MVCGRPAGWLEERVPGRHWPPGEPWGPSDRPIAGTSTASRAAPRPLGPADREPLDSRDGTL